MQSLRFALALGISFVAIGLSFAQEIQMLARVSPTVPGATGGFLRSVDSHPSGNFAIGGVMNFGPNASSRRGYVAMVSPSGAILWFRLIIGDATGPGVQVEKIRVLGDGSVMAACIGESLTGVRFNGTTGNVIRSTRRPGACGAADIGPDGSMYFERNSTTPFVAVDTTNSDGTRTVGFTYTRTLGFSKIALTGTESLVTINRSERNLTTVNPFSGAATRSVESSFGHLSKFLFDAGFVAMVTTNIADIAKEVATVTQFREMSYIFSDPTTSATKQKTDAMSLTNRQVRLAQAGFGDNRDFFHQFLVSESGASTTQSFTSSRTGTGGFISTANNGRASERIVQVGGFTHRTAENRFAPGNNFGNFTDFKFDSANVIVYGTAGHATLRDAKTIAEMQYASESPLTIGVGRRNIGDGSLIDVPITFTNVLPSSGAAYDKLNKGQFAFIGADATAPTAPMFEIFELVPQLKSDAFTGTRDPGTNIATVSGNVLANDIHAVGGTVTLHQAPAVGTVTGPNAAGDFTFVSPVGFSGSTTFKYRVAKAGLTFKVATVTITVP